MWYAVMMLVDMRVFLFSTCLATLSTWELVVGDTVHGEDNLEEKTREDADIRMYYLVPRFEFVHQGRDMLLWWWVKWEFLC